MNTLHRGDCDAFALCRNSTDRVHLHALLGPVATCERCAERLGVTLYPATDDMAAIYADYWEYRRDAETGPFPERPLPFLRWAADPVLCVRETADAVPYDMAVLALLNWWPEARRAACYAVARVSHG